VFFSEGMMTKEAVTVWLRTSWLLLICALLECAMHLYDPEKSAKREGRLSPLSELQVKQFPDEKEKRPIGVPGEMRHGKAR